MSQRVLNVKQLQDGTERVCIHYLVEGDGPISFKSMAGVRIPGREQVIGYIACNPEQNTIFPQVRNGETFLCIQSNEVRAVTCPKCLATPAAIAMLDRLKDTESITPVMTAEDVAGINQLAKSVTAELGPLIGPGVMEKTANKTAV